MTVKQLLHTAKVHTTGGREGTSSSTNGCPLIQLSNPVTADYGTNPEQLFAASWSACFIGAMRAAAKKLRVDLPANQTIGAEVDLTNCDGALSIQARLNVRLPGLNRNIAQALVEAAEQICPYSEAIRGNISVVINLV